MGSNRHLDFQIETVVKGWLFYFDESDGSIKLLAGASGKPVGQVPSNIRLITAVEAAHYNGRVSCVVPNYSTESGIEVLQDYMFKLHHSKLAKLGKTSIRLYENRSPKSIQDKGIDGSNMWIVYSKWRPDPLLSEFPSASITAFDKDPRLACIKAVKAKNV